MAQAEFFYRDPSAPRPNRPNHLGAAVLIEYDGRILMEHRADSENWAMIGGGLEIDETLAQCALREIREETGMVLKEADLEFFRFYDDPSRIIRYPDGNIIRSLTMTYRVHLKELPQLRCSEESRELKFLTLEEIEHIPVAATHRHILEDLEKPSPRGEALTGVISMNYQEINSKATDSWCRDGWQWGQPISHETYVNAQNGQWDVVLTPTKPVPHSWFGDLAGKKLLGLASGGGQQIPIFSALGAECTVLDYSAAQCESERLVAQREGYNVTIIQGDMTKRLPFEDNTFDIIFQPVSNCYAEEVRPIFKECYRILKKGGILICGLDNCIIYIFGEDDQEMKYRLPFNPLKNKQQYEDSIKNDWGITFSHTIEEQIGGQLEAGFRLTNLYEDTSGEGRLHDFGVPTFFATRAVKE